MDRDIKLKDIAVTAALMILNAGVFVLLSLKHDMSDPETLISLGGVYWPLVIEGEYLRLFTAMFLHCSAAHLASNLLVMFVLGSVVERALGRWRYIIVYILSGTGASAVSCLYSRVSGIYIVSAGASGALFGVMGALVVLAYAGMADKYGIDKRRVPLMLVVSIAGGLWGNDNIDLPGHIGGLVSGLLITLVILFIQRFRAGSSRQDDRR